jgi:septal ring factor EnvC (AmiA/AmiB activator)
MYDRLLKQNKNGVIDSMAEHRSEHLKQAKANRWAAENACIRAEQRRAATADELETTANKLETTAYKLEATEAEHVAAKSTIETLQKRIADLHSMI